jgi:hypothetical protein
MVRVFEREEEEEESDAVEEAEEEEEVAKRGSRHGHMGDIFTFTAARRHEEGCAYPLEPRWVPQCHLGTPALTVLIISTLVLKSPRVTDTVDAVLCSFLKCVLYKLLSWKVFPHGLQRQLIATQTAHTLITLLP